MATDRLPKAGDTLVEPSLWHLRVVDTRPLSDTLQRVILTAPGLEGLQHAPGQDMMLRVPRPDGKVTNRRYTIRSFDAALPTVTLDVSLHGAGPGTDWIRTARIGDELDALGPRGKITPRMDADWHFFVGDETGMPGALAMIEALPSATTVRALLEVDSTADEQEPDSPARDVGTALGPPFRRIGPRRRVATVGGLVRYRPTRWRRTCLRRGGSRRGAVHPATAGGTGSALRSDLGQGLLATRPSQCRPRRARPPRVMLEFPSQRPDSGFPGDSNTNSVSPRRWHDD